MTRHVFVDESKRRDFVLVAAAVPLDSLKQARDQIRSLYLPGQHRLHMVKESRGLQVKILMTIAALEVGVTIYVAAKGSYPTERHARRRCLEALLADVAHHGYPHLCIERDDSSAREDRRLIHEQLGALGYRNRLRYTHDKALSEPLLAIPDAIAWAWPQRGAWNQLCSPVVEDVRSI